METTHCYFVSETEKTNKFTTNCTKCDEMELKMRDVETVRASTRFFSVLESQDFDTLSISSTEIAG